MQDVHCPAGLIGYFPTYAPGNLISAHVTAVSLNRRSC
ncbi:MAG: hypothetical protein KAS17_04525 [Victivallaceae bacterium]|nr:hypothetical protein [Victivallaceae bacterium]